jgi:hypothetical protein
MASVLDINLIRLFDFYLAVMLLLGVYRRWGVYRDALLLLIGFVLGRWGRLLSRLHTHRHEVLNWPTLRPMALALLLMAAQMITSRLVFPQAAITLRDLLDPWWQLALAIAAFAPMAAVDLYFIIRVGRFDHGETVKYFDQAETWAGTWRATAVRTVTLGRVNPNRMVDEQVRDGLKQLGATLSWAMWWVSTQVILRLAFGLTLWLLWALRPT